MSIWEKFKAGVAIGIEAKKDERPFFNPEKSVYKSAEKWEKKQEKAAKREERKRRRGNN